MISFVVNVGAGVAPGVYDNTASASALNHPTIDDDGLVARDADTLPTDTPETDEDVRVENPHIGVAKAVTNVLNNPDGTYDVTYLITVRNYGDVALSNVQVSDNLGTTFALGHQLHGGQPDQPGLRGEDESARAATPVRHRTRICCSARTPWRSAAAARSPWSVQVRPGGNLGPYNNWATATGRSPAGQTVSDLSQVGVDPDPTAAPPDGNPNNNGNPTPVSFTVITQIGVAKRLDSVTNNGDATYDVAYELMVKNLGDTLLSNVQVSDVLSATFTGATGYSVVSKTSATFSINPSYNGGTNTNLLQGSNTLAAGASGTISLVVRVTPGSKLGTYDNQALATATGPGGVPTLDSSDDGTNPDFNGNRDPSDTGENDPTPVAFTETPKIGTAKQVVGTPTNNGDGTYTVQYRILVQNVGDVVLNNVQVTDNLAGPSGTFPAPAAFSFVAGSISTTGGLTGNNAGYTGSAPNTNLLASGNSLAKGAEGTITFSVKVTPDGVMGPYNNLAVATGASPQGTPVNDTSTDVLPSGDLDTDPDTPGLTPADNLDPSDDSVPTPVSFTERPLIGTAKRVVSNVNNGNGTYTVVYEIKVRNYGDVILNSVQVTDSLASTFPAPATATASSLTAGAGLTANWPAGYNGFGNINLLAGSNSLAVGASKWITLTVLVTPGAAQPPFSNVATAAGTSPKGTRVTDPSQDGINPDPGPNPDGNPTNNNVPTPIWFAENPVVGIAKELVSVVDNGATKRVTYRLYVENLGDVTLLNLQVTDNLANTFTGAVDFNVFSATSR